MSESYTPIPLSPALLRKKSENHSLDSLSLSRSGCFGLIEKQQMVVHPRDHQGQIISGAFIPALDLYQLECIPFRPTGSPSTFVILMNKCLKGLQDPSDVPSLDIVESNSTFDYYSFTSICKV